MRIPVQELIDKYRNNLFGVAFNVCKNTEDAEDVIQDAFLQYYMIKKNLMMKNTLEHG